MKVRPRADGNGWLLDLGIVDGRRVRRTFPSREDAEIAAAQWRLERRRDGERVASLAPETKARWMAWDERCRAAGGSLDEAAEFWLASRPGAEAAGRETVGTVLPKWSEAHAGTRSGRHLDQVARHWRDFEADAGAETKLAAVTAAGVTKHLDGHGWGAATRGSRRASLSCVFGWAVSRRLAASNPCALVHRPELPPGGDIRFLSVPEARSLLEAAAGAGDGGDLLAYVALGMFGGVRRAEIERARAGDVHLDTAEFVVSTGKMGMARTARRTRKRRVVDLEPVAVAWLRRSGVAERPGDNRLIGPNFRRRWERVLRAAVADWPSGALRHTYATYHYALHRDERRLQAMMGHDSADVLHAHYRGLARRADAEEFWKLWPV